MPTRLLAGREELEDFVRGCVFFGTGGGGNPDEGLRLLQAEVDAGRKVGWVDVDEIPDDAWSVRISRTGTTAPPTPDMVAEKERLGLGPADLDQLRSIQELSLYTGREIRVIVPPELGAGNSSAALATAARGGLLAVDGDYVGRAIPEIAMTTPCLAGKPIWPLASVDRWGNCCIIKHTLSYELAERFARHMAMASFGNTGLAGFLLQAREMKQIVVRNTMSQCLELGRTIREARRNRKDPVEAAVRFVDGWLLFDGVVVRKTGENRGGFYWGEHLIEGRGAFAGHTMRVWFKNECLLSWKDGAPYVTAPDLIVLMERENGEPRTNNQVEEGLEIAVVGVRAREPYRTKAGVEILGPRHFGFDLDYVPIEQLVGRQPNQSVR